MLVIKMDKKIGGMGIGLSVVNMIVKDITVH